MDNHDKLSLRAIAKECKCSYEWVRTVLKMANIKKNRVKKPKLRIRNCARCGVVIANEKYNKYCPKCRHIVLAKTFFRINQELRRKRKTR